MNLVLCTLIFMICGWGVVLCLGHVAESRQRSKYKAQSAPRINSELPLLELGQAAKIRAVADSAAEVKVVSYNIRWRSGEELRQLAQLLKTDPEIGGATILGLQEVDRNKQRTGNRNTARLLAEELGMYYAWAAPDAPNSEPPVSQTRPPLQHGAVRVAGNGPAVEAEEETGVAILSSYPLSQVQRILLPHEGPGRRRRVALGATITCRQTNLRVYSVHSETRISVARKLDQMKAVLVDLAHYRPGMPAIVMGDFNTWEQDAVAKTFKLFTAENFHTPFDEQATFFRRALFVSIDLKLDWIWLRHLDNAGYGVNRDIKLSDHWPLWVVLKTRAGNDTRVRP